MANSINWGKIYDTTYWGSGIDNNINWGSSYKDLAQDDRFIITVKTDNAGTSLDTQFTIPTNTTGNTIAYNYDIATSDGQTITGNTGDTTITFPTAGTYDIEITGDFPRIFFANTGDKLKLLDIKNFGIYALGSTSQSSAFYGCSNMDISASDVGYFGDVTNLLNTWLNCTSLTSFPLINTSNVINFIQTWFSCSSLTSLPLLDTSSGTDFVQTWRSCSSLSSFPLINTSSGTNFNGTWLNCSSLTTFPLLDTSNSTVFTNTWFGCSSLTTFPLLDTSNSTDFTNTWFGCSSLTTFPANAFDTNIALNYTNAFQTTKLTTQSIDDILVSLDTSGVSNGTFLQSGGQAPSTTGQDAIDSLVLKGWTITVTT